MRISRLLEACPCGSSLIIGGALLACRPHFRYILVPVQISTVVTGA
jgi:hypothetical protein